MITSRELFEDLYNSIKEGMGFNDVLKHYGGGAIYIPSFKTTYRNDEIKAKYLKAAEQGKNNITVVRELAREYNLTPNSIYKLIRGA